MQSVRVQNSSRGIPKRIVSEGSRRRCEEGFQVPCDRGCPSLTYDGGGGFSCVVWRGSLWRSVVSRWSSLDTVARGRDRLIGVNAESWRGGPPAWRYRSGVEDCWIH